MVLNLLFRLLKIKIYGPLRENALTLQGGFGGYNLYILLLDKSTYIARNPISTNPVNTRVQILIKEKGMPLWEFRLPLWEFRLPLWEFYSRFSNKVIHRLSTIQAATMGILLIDKIRRVRSKP